MRPLTVLAAAAAVAGCGGSSGDATQTERGTDTGYVTTWTAPTETQTETAPPAEREPPAAGVPKPRIVQRPIPFPRKRRDETAAYAVRHYGLDTWRLRDPKVIVEHVSVTPDFRSTFDAFAPDRPDPELGELPGVCSHFVVDRDGTVYQLVPLSTICRHTVGLNHVSIGIEHVGKTDAEVLGAGRQLAASLRLTRWLGCRYGIAQEDVIGHNESLSSPYHRENVARLRTQTHGDMTAETMRVYRRKLRRLGGCG